MTENQQEVEFQRLLTNLYNYQTPTLRALLLMLLEIEVGEDELLMLRISKIIETIYLICYERKNINNP
jgi:hypothetical protein